jgi:hypothetical protein
MRLHPLLFLLLPSLFGCYETGNVLTQDVGPTADAVTQDTARDAPTPLIGDPLYCDTAPFLGLDTRIENVDPTGALSPEEGSCFEPNSEVRLLHYRVEIPARTGVEVRTAGTNPPVVSFTDRCGRGGASRCVFFQNTNGDSGTATSRRWYYGNPSDATQTLWVNLKWFPTTAASGGRAPAPFSLETQSYALPVESNCETPLSLPENTLLPASPARGGTYENWECVRRTEAHFVSITIPPRSQAVALAGSQGLNQRSECGCTPGLPFVNLLNNFSDAPSTVTLERIPEEPIGVRYAALPANATCARAIALEVAANEASARPTPIAAYAATISEFRESACGAFNDAVWYRVTIPPGRSVRVRAEMNSPYPVLAAFSACGEAGSAECTDLETGLALANPTGAAIEQTIVVGYEGPPAETPIVGSISAFLTVE